MRILFVASILLASIYPAMAADERSYSAGHFQLDIAGRSEGLVAPIDNGSQGIVATSATVPANAVAKQNTGIGAIQARPGVIQRQGLQRSNNPGLGTGNKSDQTTQSSNNKDTGK